MDSIGNHPSLKLSKTKTFKTETLKTSTETLFRGYYILAIFEKFEHPPFAYFCKKIDIPPYPWRMPMYRGA
ncbi:hypothetical protein [Paenibacillus terrae]|uniref:hypothetical protein n=1 Tax=Paenibacillus terrae TaxID=159743 RepID=UPI0016568627|nr:hypothetical protein [Paenibacillus terrae]MBE0335268.1 hypothetical protein [Paenibacillus sp. 23TSA30-6]